MTRRNDAIDTIVFVRVGQLQTEKVDVLEGAGRGADPGSAPAASAARS